MLHTVTTTHLIMDSPARLKPRLLEGDGIAVRLIDPPNPQLNHAFFMEIGSPYRWFSRLGWRLEEWRRYAEDPTVETWIGFSDGTPFGYFELQSRGAVTEIMFFGIFLSHTGHGLGAHLLTCAAERAWGIPTTERVYVHTCTSDHPAALANYIARGFSVEREVIHEEEMPDQDDPVWTSPAYYRSLQNITVG